MFTKYSIIYMNVLKSKTIIYFEHLLVMYVQPTMLDTEPFPWCMQVEPHRLPSIFTRMQRRDEGKRRHIRSKDSENIFNSNGCIETVDRPTDIFYKRDSIMHSNVPRDMSAAQGEGVRIR